MEMENMGEKIQEARKAKGWTQDTLAEKMFVSRSAVANWEQGRRMPDVATLTRLMKLLNCQLGDFPISQMPLDGSENEALAVFDSEEISNEANPTEELDPESVQNELAKTDIPPEESNLAEKLGKNAANNFSECGKSETISEQSVEKVSFASEKSTPVYSVDPVSKNAANGSGLSRKKVIPIALAVLVAMALLLWLVIVPALQPKSKGIPYTSADGEVYTMERMQQQAENIPGKAYLIVNPSVQINHGESTDYYLFEFKYHEMNGIALSIDRLELVYFSKLKQNAFFINTAEDIKQQYGMTVDIPAYGDWSYISGLPVQDTAYGVGVLLHCTDENAQKLSFTSYISFPEL